MALASEPVATTLPSALPDRARWSRRVRRTLRSTVVVLGSVFALLVVAMALFAGPLAPAPPDEPNFDLIESPPGRQALFGTDRFGRDVLSRVIYGARISLYVATVSIGVAMLAGGALGLAAGFKKGPPYVDEVVLRIIPDEANIVAALRTGQLHHAFIEDNKNYNLLKDEKTLTGYRSSRLGYDFLNINASRGPLKDVRVRQAISWAVDRGQILRVAAAGFGRLTPPATAPMRQWQLPEDAWMKYYRPDLDKAKKLLADAGHAGGFTVKLGVIPTFPTMVAGAPVVAAQLKKIGITAEIENVEYAVWIKRWLAKDFDLTMNTTPGYADPDTAFFRALHSTKGQNWNSWSVPDLDGLLGEGRRTMDQKKRKEIYDKAQVLILENVPHLWLFSADTIDFTQTSVKGFKQHPTTLLYGFEGVWLDKA